MQGITLNGQRQTVQMRLHEDYWKATVTSNQGGATANVTNFNMNGKFYRLLNFHNLVQQSLIRIFCLCMYFVLIIILVVPYLGPAQSHYVAPLMVLDFSTHSNGHWMVTFYWIVSQPSINRYCGLTSGIAREQESGPSVLRIFLSIPFSTCDLGSCQTFISFFQPFCPTYKVYTSAPCTMVLLSK